MTARLLDFDTKLKIKNIKKQWHSAYYKPYYKWQLQPVAHQMDLKLATTP